MNNEIKILIVDDKPENLTALASLLQDFNVSLIKAFSGFEALENTLEHEFALALIDVQMPEMDGFETVRHLRQVEKTRLLPVILVSAVYSDYHHLIEGVEAGAIDFITKPIIPEILRGKTSLFIEQYIQKISLQKEISQRIETEKALRETEKQLKWAKAKAEESDRLKSAFLANVSHEIRTPLNAIVGFSNLLTSDLLNEEQRIKYANYINNSSNNLTNIIDDILDIAKIEAGRLKLIPETVDLPGLLSELKSVFTQQIENFRNNSIEVRYVENSDYPGLFIHSDGFRLRQILTNLISNAIKFTDSGYVEFGYHLEDSEIHIYVKDTGIGIPKDQYDNVFQRFSRIEQSNTDKIAPGTGLGLSIVRKLTDMLDGRVELESELGKGSVFSLIFKREIISDPSPYGNPEEVIINTALPNWENIKVLIAEDEDTNYELLRSYLQPTHAHTIWAKNGREAIEKCREENPQLVLMDIKMPEMNGIDALKEIRNYNDKIPVIAQTAFATRENSDFNEYITKPVKRHELFSVMRRYL